MRVVRKPDLTMTTSFIFIFLDTMRRTRSA